MTTAAQVRSAFSTSVFGHSSIVAISPKVLFFEVAPESESEIDDIYYQNQVNFFECVVSRGESYPLIGGADKARYQYLVEVRYTKERDPDGSNSNDAQDAINTLCSIVASELGSDWGGLVDVAEPQEGVTEQTTATVAGVTCFRAIYRFQATKQT